MDETLQQTIRIAVHVFVAATLAPLLLGIINKTKAAFAGRQGPPVLQPFYDLYKLFQKGSVFSPTTTWVFRAGPLVSFVTVTMALLFIPLGQKETPLSFTGDLILFTYLLALGRFFVVASALDTGSAFEGMGAAREATFAVLAEPAFFFGLLTLAKLSGSLNLAGMLSMSHFSVENLDSTALASLFLVLVSWFIVLLVENCRIPFDDPNTHLELTMIHEVMVLDHSGPAFGMILYGASLKLFLFSALLIRAAIPLFPGQELLNWGIFIAAQLFLAVLVGVIESTMARLRIVHIPNLLVGACVLSAFGIILLIVG